jgi:hypothetical protein
MEHWSCAGDRHEGSNQMLILRYITALCLLMLFSHEAYSQGCQYMGGYPWQTGGCLVANDLNNAIAGRNPLLNTPSVPNKWVSYFKNGEAVTTQPKFSDIAGTLPPDSVPLASALSPGGVFAYTSPASQFFYALDGTGHFVSRQASFLDIAGVVAPTQIPFPSNTGIGGVKSYTAPAGQYLTGVSTDGTFTVAPIAGGVVQTNALLKTTLGTPGLRYLRAGFATPGDGGAAYYDWSASNCPVADNGAQAQPTGVTGCWIADFSGMRPTPRVWGAVGNGTTDDTAAVQAALNASMGRTLFLGKAQYCITAVTMSIGTTIQGESHDSQNNPSAFYACADNVKMIKTANSAVLNDFLIDAGANAHTGNVAVDTVLVSKARLKNLFISNPCIGWDEGGNSNHMTQSNIYSTQNVAGCVAVRIGHDTTNASVTLDAQINTTTINGGGDADVKIEDCGGCRIGPGNDFLGQPGSKHGIWVYPGLNQEVSFLDAIASYIGDTTASSGLEIDTADPSAIVRSLLFTDTWTSASSTSGVVVKNTAGGSVSGIHFVGHRSNYNQQYGFWVAGNVSDFSIDASFVCSNSTAGTNVAQGILLESGINGAAVRNTRSGVCDNFNTGTVPTTGLLLNGNASNLIITDNDLRGNGTALQQQPGSLTGAVIIKNNLGVDDTTANIADAATIALTALPNHTITGTGTTITTVNNFWAGREVKLLMQDGSVTLATGGNLCNGGAFAQNTVAILTRMPGSICWSVK